ncbi:NAD(P)H-dependent oxidoreductase [Sphingomonas sp. G-3-2-10]|uniref:NADPH-dependent FMN reductase n=1 Tax=Sphingomonas sp. G-3-2-10 TaxID=2728838 RepID=UPI00146B7AAA|nr:NAD(P)H-dependent oxidoreductase [Sphingomonas sp. G-3-2-10]NML08528.1 NAD(P)H-dependent oxidoreductase [Sphingomonas sp. G-3-2-10]
MSKPFILGIGGTTRAGSSSELVLRAALKEIEALGAETECLAGPDMVLPLYAPENPERDPKAQRLIELVRRADGIVIASPGYHGSISGMIKNALDYVEDTAKDDRVYLDGRAVGCIACAYGWQATGSTLIALRTIVHALRGWPTPLGVAANTTTRLFGDDGDCSDASLSTNLRILAGQVMHFVQLSAAPKDKA